MAEKEKRILDGLAELPDALQDEFLSQIQGAATAVKVLADAPEKKEAAKSG